MHEDNGQAAPCLRLWFWNPCRKASANVQILAMMSDYRARHRPIHGLMSLLRYENNKINCQCQLVALSWLTKSNLFPRPQYCIRCSCCAFLSQLSYTKTGPTRLLAEDIERWIFDRHSRANPFVELPVGQLAPACCRKFCKIKGIVINERSGRKSRISKAPRVEMCTDNLKFHTQKYIKLSLESDVSCGNRRMGRRRSRSIPTVSALSVN